MRKHFLILMLLSLLPLAGWAADLDVSKFTAANIAYGSTALGAISNTQGLTAGTDYVVETSKFYTSNTGGGETAIGASGATLKITSVGEYFIKVSGANSYAGQEIFVSFRIYKATNSVTTVPVAIDATTWTGNEITLIKNTPVPAAQWGNVEYVVTANDVTVAPTTGWSTSAPKATNTGTYKVWYRAEANETNYFASDAASVEATINGEEASTTKTIAAKTGLKYTGNPQALITVGEGTVTGGTIKYSLDGGAWTETIPTATNVKNAYVVSWMIVGDNSHNDKAKVDINVEIAKGDPVISGVAGATGLTYDKTEKALLANGGSVTLGATLKYSVRFKKHGGDYGDAEVKTSAGAVKGTNAGVYEITAKADATGNTNAVEGTPFEVTIAKKNAYAYVEDQTKVYDATAFAVGAVQINGLVGNDALTTNPTAAYATATPSSPNVGSYTIELTGGASDNYIVNNTNGTYTITARPITLTAMPQTITYGQDAPEFAVNTTYIEVEAKGTDKGCALASNDANYDTHVAGILNAIQSVGLNGTYTNAGTHSNVIVITKKADAATLVPNYTIEVQPGTYTINPAGGYTLVAKNKTVTYGDSYTLDYLHPQGDVRDGKTVTFTVYQGTTALENYPTAAGEYTIKINPNAEYAPTNYAGDITYEDGTLTINPKELAITFDDQTLTNSKKATDLAKSKVHFTNLVGPDVVDFTLAFNTGDGEEQIPAANVTEAGALQNIADNTTFNNGIKIASIANSNYSIPAAYGKLIVANAASITLGANAATDATTIATYAGTSVNVKMNFAARNGRTLGDTRNWEGEYWTTMVLPFDISVADLSQKLGYAIVNVINPAKTVIDGRTGSKFYGKLTMKGGNGNDTKLAANKPFLVKIAENVVTTDIDFGDQTIVAPTDLSVNADDDGTTKFVGTYATKHVDATDKAATHFMLGNYTEWAHIDPAKTSTWDIVPFEAYLDLSGLPEGAARNITFYAEELDGTVTAIKGISTDNVNSAKQNVEGWYNLNGVKMQGAPTQKGVYINNGKKIVVK
ncbi:MAG: hypothetical protein IJ544_07045 [Prevotella sp.]|nr:hypothetical protein [Prevotella sp.]